MALTPDGRKLYVACGRSDAVAVIDTATNQKIADIPVGIAAVGRRHPLIAAASVQIVQSSTNDRRCGR